MDQYYFVEGYLEAGYLTVVKEASAGFTPYFAEGYLPAGYFDYQGSSFSLSASLIKVGDNVSGIGSWSTSVSTVITANVIRSGQLNITATFTQTATISHIEGAELFAFSNAQLEAAVRRIRDNNITASAAFSVAVDFVRTRTTSSDQADLFTFSAINARSRDFDSAQSAAFSLAATIDNRTRDQSSALASQFAFTATISHIEGADLSAFSNASLTATPDKIKSISVTLSSSATQSASAQRLRGGVVNLSSSSSVFARPKFGVTWIDAVGQDVPNSASSGTIGASIDNSEFKFGTGSLKLESSFNLAGIVATTNANDLSIPAFDNNTTSNFSISFWVKGSGGGGTVYHLGNESLNLKVSVANNSVGLEYTPLSGQTANYFTVGTNNLTIQNWNFIEVAGVYNSSGGGRRILDIYVNGVGQGVSVASDPNYAKLQNGLAVGNLGAMICSVATRIFYIDDFQYRVGTSAVIGSLPTSQAQGSGPSTTKTLLNLNGTFDDTNYVITHSGLADLDAISTVTANVERVRFVFGEAALASSSSCSATILRIKSSGVALDSAFTQATNTDLSRTRGLTTNQNAVFTQSSQAVKTTNIVLDLNSQSAFTATISHIHGADLTAFSNVTVSTTAVVTRSASSTQSSEFTSSADNSRTRSTASNVSSEFTQASSAIKTATAAAQITSQVSVSTIGTRVRFAATDIVSASSLSASVQRIKVASAALTSVFRTEQLYFESDYFANGYFEEVGIRAVKTARIELVLQGFAFELVDGKKTAIADPLYLYIFSDFTSRPTARSSAGSGLQSVATVSANTRKSAVANAALTSAFSVSATIDNRTRSQTSNLASAFSVTAAVNEFQGLAVLMSSQFTQTANNTRTRAFDSALNSAATQSVTGLVTRTFSSSLSSTSTFSATISHIHGADLTAFSNASLSVNAFVGKVAEAALASAFIQSASGARTRDLSSSQSSAFAQSATIDNRTRDQSASLASAFAVTCTISHIEGANLVAFSASTVTTQATKTTTTSLTATSASNFTATADKFRAFSANLALSTSLSANALKLVNTQATLQAQAVILANAGKITQGLITIASAMTFVAQIREIDADSLTQFVYTIPAENWLYTIPDEIPVYDEILYVIPNENWIYTISEETREVVLEQETRIYNIRST